MRQLLNIVGLLVFLTIGGTIGYRVMAGTDWVESLYLAVITVTTVGSREPVPLSDSAKIFVVVYLMCGVGIFTYGVFRIGQMAVSAQLGFLLEKRRMDQRIRKLQNHFIVCGRGRMGSTICEYLAHHRQPFVVIDHDPLVAEEALSGDSWLHIVGDATDDAVLRAAGIERARSLATVLPTDGDNIYVVLSAKLLAPQLQVVARVSAERAIEKMLRAGADRVISPFSTGAVKMARFMLNPSVEDFLEIADDRGNELELADVQIPAASPYVGKQLRETDLRERGVMVIGIRRENGERLMPPPGTAVLQAGDSLFAFGSAKAVNDMIASADPQPNATS